MTDFQLYNLLKSLYQDIRSGIVPSMMLMEGLEKEAEIRNPDIVKNAYNDSYLENALISDKVRFEHLNSDELNQFLSLSSINVEPDLFSEFETNFLKLFDYHPEEIRFIKVKGDSMDGVGIFENDILMYKLGNQVESGSIYIFKIKNEMEPLFSETYVKQIIIENVNKIIMRSANTRYEDRELDNIDKLLILGKVVKVINVKLDF